MTLRPALPALGIFAARRTRKFTSAGGLRRHVLRLNLSLPALPRKGWVSEASGTLRKLCPQRLKPDSRRCRYRSGEPLRHPKSTASKIKYNVFSKLLVRPAVSFTPDAAPAPLSRTFRRSCADNGLSLPGDVVSDSLSMFRRRRKTHPLPTGLF